MEEGWTISFTMYDNLFKDVIKATGVIVNRVFGKLWNISPDVHPRLSGSNVIIHENFIKPATGK